jgi:hypothetical protein
MKLPGFERKLRVAIDWTLDLFFPRDIVYLRPLHSAHGPAPVSHAMEGDGEACSIDSSVGGSLRDPQIDPHVPVSERPDYTPASNLEGVIR